jgi:hypothetical protein
MFSLGAVSYLITVYGYFKGTKLTWYLAFADVMFFSTFFGAYLIIGFVLGWFRNVLPDKIKHQSLVWNLG